MFASELQQLHEQRVSLICPCLRRFCPNNPTGRYKLVLGRTLDYMIARRLVSIYQEEFAKGLVEVDGRTTTCFNNSTLDSKPFMVTDPYEWKLPRQVRLAACSPLPVGYTSYAFGRSSEPSKLLGIA